MKRDIDLAALGHSASLFLAIAYALCAAFDLAFPQWAMAGAWQKLLPGSDTAGWKGFLVGLAESYAYGWFFAVIWAPLYNFFSAHGGGKGELT